MSNKKILINIALTAFLFINLAGENVQARHSWKYYHKKGMIQFRAEMYDYSLFNLQNSLELNPENYEAANILAEIYYIKNKKMKSIDYYVMSLKINNGQAHIHVKIGELYDFFHERKQAFKHFIKAVALEPDNIRGNLNLVRYYIRKKDKSAADRHFRISYRAGLKKSADTLHKAQAEAESGNDSKALSLFKMVIAESPSVVDAYISLYELYRKRNNFIKAADIIEKLKFYKPDHEMACVMLGNIYFTRKLPGKRKVYLDLALKNYKQAVSINPQNPESYFMIAKIYEFIGDDIQAGEWEKKAERVESRADMKK